MGTEKRERQKAQRAARLEAERAAEARAKRIRTAVTMVFVAACIIALMYVLASCSSSSASDGATPVNLRKCPPAAGSKTKQVDFPAAPPMCIDRSKTYTAHVTTNVGKITVVLDIKRTPKTTNNFVV